MKKNFQTIIVAVLLLIIATGNNAFAQCTCTAGCSSLTVITMPFTKDGAGEVCYQAACLGTSINSWNVDKIDINGTDFTNKWADASTYPAAASDGYYYIYYKASYSWSHFEALGTCSGTVTTAPTLDPTAEPNATDAPTDVPTAVPTYLVDTVPPTTAPTPDPTSAVIETAGPTDVPTATPAPTATPGPTSVPTATPVGVTDAPTDAPVITDAPTAVPVVTDVPTAAPTTAGVTPEPTTPAGSIPTPYATNSLGAPVVRVNQAGYFTTDTYKTAVVAGVSGTFTVYNAVTGSSVYSGTLTSLGTDSELNEILYLADFSSLQTAGTYYIMVGSEPSYKFEISDNLYNKVLYYTLRVYGANRCGAYGSWIHESCHTQDGSIFSTARAGSLTGGWHDCGDHVKFGGTLGYASAMLLYSYMAFPEKFGDNYGTSFNGTFYGPAPDGIPDVLNEAKVGTDYILNLYNASVTDGLIAANKMYYQVGDGDDDHTWWHKPEYQDPFGQSRGGAPREVWSDISSGIAGRFAASLAMMSIVYSQYDAAYATNCLNAAKAIYDVGKNLYGITGLETGGKGYYQMDTRCDDDMALAGTILYKATGTDYYINNTTGAAYWMYKELKWQFQSYYVLSFPNVFALALHAYYEFAPTVDNDPSVVDTQIVTKAECIEWLKADVNSATPTSEIYGRKWAYGWGTCRYMMGVAATATLALDLDPTDATMLKVAKDQMNWIFGRNQFGLSFVVGNTSDAWLTRYPQHPHHRAANPDGENVAELDTYAATELTGGTIGGPSAHTTFSDAWDDYVSTETGIDYWAGTFFTAAYFAQ